MNETTDKLIRDLAEKLGTTADHLWGVLCRQATISGITNLLVIGVWAALIVWGFKFVRSKTTAPPKTEEDRYPRAEWDEEGKVIAWLILGAATIITVLVVGSNLEYIVGSLLNPEYWALKQIVR
jgi:hypothetical protein